MLDSFAQQWATVYWSVLITETLVIILFVMSWMHVNTMTKRQERIEALLKKLDKRLDETIDEIAAIPDPPQPQGYMPVYPQRPPQ